MALLGSYLDRDGFKARTVAPASLVEGTFLATQGERDAWTVFVDAQLVAESARINARLRKRYAVPFGDPPPEIVCAWLTARVTPKLYERRGWDPSDAQAESLLSDAKDALDEMKEAADSVEGLYDLPLRADTTEDGISKGGPLVYSEASPYSWVDVQAETIRGGSR